MGHYIYIGWIKIIASNMNMMDPRCRGAVGDASGSAEDGEEILGVAHDDDE